MHTLKTSWILRYTLLLCMGFMMSFSLSGQITFTPRVSYNWANYRANDCFTLSCPNSRSNLAVGLNVSRGIFQDAIAVAGVNFYLNKVTYPGDNSRVNNIDFNHFDVKLGIKNKIFSERTLVGIGIQAEFIFNAKDLNRVTNEIIKYPNNNYMGIEFSVSHRFNKFELFFDAFYNFSAPSLSFLLYHQNFQLGIGYPIKVKNKNE